MSFFRTAWRAASDPSFYTDRERQPFGPGLRYLVGWVLILSLVGTACLALSFRDFLHGMSLAKLRQRIINVYPAELVLTLEDGRIASNVDEPYAIALPAEFSACHDEDCPQERLPKSLVVIDTTKPIESADFKRHDTLIILGAREVGFANPKDNKIEIHRLDSFSKENFSLNRVIFTEIVQKAFHVLKWLLIVGLFLVPIVLFAAFLLGILFYLLAGALIVLLMAKLRKLQLTYGQAYKLGFYLLTPTLAYNVITSSIWPVGHLPFIGSLILAVSSYALLRTPVKAVPAVAVQPAESSEPSAAPTSESTPGDSPS